MQANVMFIALHTADNLGYLSHNEASVMN